MPVDWSCLTKRGNEFGESSLASKTRDGWCPVPTEIVYDDPQTSGNTSTVKALLYA